MTGVGFEPTTYGLKAPRLPRLTWYQNTLSTENVRGAHIPKGAFVRCGTSVNGGPGHNEGHTQSDYTFFAQGSHLTGRRAGSRPPSGPGARSCTAGPECVM